MDKIEPLLDRYIKVDDVNTRYWQVGDAGSPIVLLKRSNRTSIEGFVLLPKRWVVERTFGWLSWCRRLSRDREGLPDTSEMWIYIAMIRIMIRRLA
ncbi:transposase [Chamaesiphon sp. VAR_69_metabat_338]|uniref:transposase n=1 Tax=Chamaesiphon sp. VAR_69_metabat_338 TaxID=2964704 RepID=UPI0037BF6CAC